MFAPDVSYDDAIDLVLDGPPVREQPLPAIHEDITAHGGMVADDDCPSCDGLLYELDNELVCGNCSMVLGSGGDQDRSPTRWEHFRDNRPEYGNSNRQRCPGGFPHAYEWVKREDIDHPVREVEPNSFYR